jgi:hypothetical protein
MRPLGIKCYDHLRSMQDAKIREHRSVTFYLRLVSCFCVATTKKRSQSRVDEEGVIGVLCCGIFMGTLRRYVYVFKNRITVRGTERLENVTHPEGRRLACIKFLYLHTSLVAT